MERSRIDIKMRNVFISWTGADCALKDRIVERLVAGKITCTVSDGKSSDGRCSGNFVQWSADAAKSANIFLLILTENTLRSAYVPLEIKEFLNIEDAENRIIVVCPSLALWRNAIFNYGGEKIKLSERNISITEMPDCVLTDKILDDVYAKTTDLINNRAYKVYREEISPKYIDILSLYDDDAPDRKIKFSDLYINRHVTEKDEYGNIVATYPSPELLVKCDDIFYICGPAGSGKTQYIHQLQNSVGEDSLVITLSCSKIATSSATLRELMFEEFCRVLGNPIYFTEDNFVNLLNNRRLVLVLDGLDEIASQSGVRTFIKKVEEEYYARHNADTTLFITGRDEKSSNRIALTGKKLRILYLEQLTDEETHTLGNNLFLSFGSSMNSDGFFVRIKDLQDEIKYNPLLLSQLAVIYKENGDVPNTVVGIFDAISKITLNIDASKHYTSIPERYMDMIEQISTLLKRFAQRRYILQSNDEECSPQEIFEDILFNDYKDDYTERAAFLVEFLLKRSILVDNGNRFYHKMFLEYFTAVYYYERSILRRKVADYDVFNELFAHYSDPYWAQVISMFLIKTDSLMNGTEMCNLLKELIKSGNIVDYTLLLDTCEGLGNNKQDAQVAIVCDILKKSAEKIYPPYGPLFWYVPTYSLYEQALLALNMLQGNAAALALVRDVCYIYGQKNRLDDITDKVDGKALLSSAPSLKGVRRALCEIFYLGDTNYTDGKNIYPRCFNVAETLSMRDNSCGVGGKMSEPFRDELGLYSHESYNELNGEYMGFVSCPYEIGYVEKKLREKATRRVTGIAYSPDQSGVFDRPSFFDETVVCYYPENIDGDTPNSRLNSKRQLNSVICTWVDIIYLHGDVTHLYSTDAFVEKHLYDSCYTLCTIKLPDSITEIQDGAFEGSGLTEIKLPAGLTKIGKQAFHNCKNLTSIVIPQGVTELSEEVFSWCEKLEKVTLPSSLHTIGAYAFSGCKALQQIDIPDTVTEIGQSAFGGCESLKTITIPNGVNQISKHCFEDCVALEQISLPQGVSQIGTGAFNNCSKLQRVHAPNVTRVENKLFCGCKTLKEVDLGEITAIGNEAFSGCENLSQLKLADSMTEIGENAFEHCALTTVNIPHGIKAIAPYAFSNCTHLTKVTIPDTVTEIGREAFKACPCLTYVDIPASVLDIGILAFGNCTSLASVQMKMGLQSIGNLAFENCENLRELVIPDSVEELGKYMCHNTGVTRVHLPESLRNIPDGAFRGCSALTEINIPARVEIIFQSAFQDCTSLESINLEPVISIYSDAFCNCKALKTVGTTSNLRGLGYATFTNCVSLQEIDLSSTGEIPYYAFAGCSQLRKVQLSEELARVYEHAFAGCVKLEQIDLGENIAEVDPTAFDGCNALKKITAPLELKREISKWNLPKGCNISYRQREFSEPDTVVVVIPEGTTEVTEGMIPNNATHVVLPDSVDYIDPRATMMHKYLTDINMPKSVNALLPYTFVGCESLTKFTVPDWVMFIFDSAFGGCSNLQEINLPDSVTDLGKEVFYGCSNLQEIYIPDSVNIIGEGAFSGCISLIKIHLPKQLSSISKNMFSGCSSLTELVIPEGVTKMEEGAFKECKLDKIVLPSTLTKFDERAFYKTEIAKVVTIPQGVTEIADEMFRESSIPHVSLPHGLQRIGNSAFRSSKIAEISLPDTIKAVGEFAFIHCSELKEVEIPQGITCIEYGTFAGCTGLQSVHLPDTLQSIREGAFGGCVSLTEIAIPDSVTKLGSIMLRAEKDELDYRFFTYQCSFAQGVFEKCTSLTKVRLPSGLTAINERTFYCCTSLGDIEIPASVTSIESLAFSHCNIKSVTIPSPFISIADDAFEETNLETLTISRNFENKIDSLFSNNKPKKIIYI